MTVKLTKIYETATTTDMPTSAAVTTTTGINAPGGPVEFLMMRLDCTWGGDPATADISNAVDSIRLICNGEVCFDFRAGAAATNNNGQSSLASFLNDIGGRYFENPGASSGATREAYFAFPIGRQMPNAVNRWEIIVSYVATAEAIASGKIEWWLRTNTAMTQQTTVVSPTSFVTTANAIEMMVVRIPANVPGTVAGIALQSSALTETGWNGAQGVRVNALSEFGVEASMWRFWNGNLANNVLFADPATSQVQQQISTVTNGYLFIPTFNLQGGQDVVLQINPTAAVTLTATPVIVAPVNARAGPEQTQSARVKGSPTAAIVARSEN